jgi:glycosyltransferase involved in cell wall biosynthesis
MGRLEHLQQSLPRIYDKPNTETIVVDWSCPEHCGDWVESCYPKTKLIRVHNEPEFHRTIPKNIGASYATGKFLCFLDADMLVEDSLFDKIITLDENKFYTRLPTYASYKTGQKWINRDGITDFDDPSTTGFIIIPKTLFSGFDIVFDKYGSEDIDLRLQLLTTGVKEEIMGKVINPIRHNDDSRTKYENITMSVSRKISREKLFKKWGRDVINKFLIESQDPLVHLSS